MASVSIIKKLSNKNIRKSGIVIFITCDNMIIILMHNDAHCY